MTDLESRLTRIELAIVHIGNIVLHSRRESGLPNPDTEPDERALEELLRDVKDELRGA